MPLIFQIVILVMSIVIHEVSHGLAAYALGDQTAKYAGRLTLNPIPHIDPFGSILLPLLLSLIPGGIIIGWAKPVPYNPYNLSNQKWGPAIVGAAGPLANLSIAVIFGIFIRLAASAPEPQFLFAFIGIAKLIVLLNILLAVFNLVPIPPLDGSKLLFAFLPYQYYNLQRTLEIYGFFILIIFIMFFSGIVGLITSYLFGWIVGQPLI